MMLSSGAIRTRIGTIVESLCRTAVTEISKIVEDGMMVLRLETCYRESEIKRLKGDIARLQVELRAAQEAGATPRREHGARENVAIQNKETSSIFVTFIPTLDHSSQPVSLAQSRPAEDRGEDPAARPPEPPRAALLDRDCDHRATPQNAHAARSENSLPHLASPSADAGSGGARHFVFGAYGGEPRKEKICPYCGKCFERSAHLERHKMIHTGEKPFQCETCGRCFNQKCSLKEHRKIHIRDAQLALQLSASGEKSAPKTAEPVQNHSLNPDETQPTAPDPAPLAHSQDAPFTSTPVKSEPVEPRFEPAHNSLTAPQALDDGNDLCLIGPSTSFLSLRPLSPPLDASGGGQQYCIKDGGVFDLPRRAPRPKKMYPCPYCPKVFWRSEHLERHVRIHTGEKPYGCYICGRFFSQTSSLKGHMKTHINIKIGGKRLGDNGGLLNPQHANFASENHTFLNVLDSKNHPEWHQAAMVKLEPKEEPLDAECGEEDLANTNRAAAAAAAAAVAAWTSGISAGALKSEDMDLESAQIDIELVPNNNHRSPAVDFETGRDDEPKQNGDAFEFADRPPDCGAAEQSMSSYICSVCGENYDNFNLFQKHQCLEQLHSGEI